jgi:hypothetical protein
MLGDDPQVDLFKFQGSRPEHSSKVIARLLGIAGATLGLAAAAILLFGKTAPKGPHETGVFLLAVAAILGYVALLIWARTAKKNPIQRQMRRLTNLMLGVPAELNKPKPQPPERVAVDLLEQIRFQQSISASWSGGVGLPLGFKLSGERGDRNRRARQDGVR